MVSFHTPLLYCFDIMLISSTTSSISSLNNSGKYMGIPLCLAACYAVGSRPDIPFKILFVVISCPNICPLQCHLVSALIQP